jgi:recombination protein RecA
VTEEKKIKVVAGSSAPNVPLDEAIAEIKKRYGKGAILVLSEHRASDPVEHISTGSPKINEILGIGGLPKGRVTEIYGPESGGKTTLALMVIAQAQKEGGVAAFIDAEHALDKAYAQNLGVDTDKLMVSQPDNGEQALEIVELLVRSGAVAVVVVDSVAALVPAAELEGDFGDAQMGLQARLMSQAMRKLTQTVSKTKTTLIFINQVRDKIGVMFGNPETTTGGRALKFYSSIRLDIRRIAQKKKGDVVIGQMVKVKIIKNKMSAPYRDCEILLTYGQGFLE